jgi:hypothetical protein
LAAQALLAGCRVASPRQGADRAGHISVFLESILYTAKPDLCLVISRQYMFCARFDLRPHVQIPDSGLWLFTHGIRYPKNAARKK